MIMGAQPAAADGPCLAGPDDRLTISLVYVTRKHDIHGASSVLYIHPHVIPVFAAATETHAHRKRKCAGAPPNLLEPARAYGSPVFASRNRDISSTGSPLDREAAGGHQRAGGPSSPTMAAGRRRWRASSTRSRPSPTSLSAQARLRRFREGLRRRRPGSRQIRGAHQAGAQPGRGRRPPRPSPAKGGRRIRVSREVVNSLVDHLGEVAHLGRRSRGWRTGGPGPQALEGADGLWRAPHGVMVRSAPASTAQRPCRDRRCAVETSGPRPGAAGGRSGEITWLRKGFELAGRQLWEAGGGIDAAQRAADVAPSAGSARSMPASKTQTIWDFTGTWS